MMINSTYQEVVARERWCAMASLQAPLLKALLEWPDYEAELQPAFTSPSVGRKVEPGMISTIP